MSRDPWNDPTMAAWARDVEQKMVPAMRSSAVVAPMWTGKIDVKLAVEMGAAVMLDKPIVLLVAPGTPVPDKLVRVADRIIEASPDAPEATADAIVAVIAELDAEGRL